MDLRPVAWILEVLIDIRGMLIAYLFYFWENFAIIQNKEGTNMGYLERVKFGYITGKGEKPFKRWININKEFRGFNTKVDEVDNFVHREYLEQLVDPNINGTALYIAILLPALEQVVIITEEQRLTVMGGDTRIALGRVSSELHANFYTDIDYVYFVAKDGKLDVESPKYKVIERPKKHISSIFLL